MTSEKASIIDYGKNVRVERTFSPAQGDQWFVYERRKVVDGTHPAHGDSTTEEYVWVRVGDGASKEDACALAEGLVEK